MKEDTLGEGLAFTKTQKRISCESVKSMRDQCRLVHGESHAICLKMNQLGCTPDDLGEASGTPAVLEDEDMYDGKPVTDRKPSFVK